MKSSEPQTNFEENVPETIQDRPRKQRQWLWLLLVIPLLVGGGYGLWRFFSGGNKATTSAPAGPPPVRVKLATVEAGTLIESEVYLASLESRRSVTLQPRIQGQVSQIFVRAGTQVASGTPIIQVDPQQQQAAVSSVSSAADGARSQVANARANLKSLEAERLSNLADVKLNEQEYERYSTLAAEGAVGRQTKEQYANRLATARATLAATESRIQAQQATISQAQNALQQAQANIKQQQVELQYYKITAPFTGTVGNIPVKVGDFVNTSTQLATITQNGSLEVNVQGVPIERAQQLRKGMPVEILDAQNRTLGMSRVFFISPNTNNNTQSILVKALFDNANGQLRADQFIRARVIWNQRSGVLIPTTAVSPIAGENFVFVTQTQQTPSGKTQVVARQKRVKLGEIKGNNYQVQEGLQPGEKIIVSGLLNLKDGAVVIPE